MIERYFQLEHGHQGPLQEQIRETLLQAIHSGTLPAGESLPSCRRLSEQLGVSRNTVARVYEGLVEDGYLISRPRSGYYLHPSYHVESLPEATDIESATLAHRPDWQRRFSHHPSNYTSILRPSNWMEYPYPFIYGQREGNSFPLSQWRESARRLLDERQDRLWLNDSYDQDDPRLIEQLRTRILPKRGISAHHEEILITLGAQNALFLIAQLLFTSSTHIAMENPGYREAYNVFKRQGAQLRLCSVDNQGIELDSASKACDYLYVTPSHQVPCGITMSPERREELFLQAEQHDQIIIEDDYDAELNLTRNALPALRSDRRGDRVIYMSSFSKSLSAGLRLGYIVADVDLIHELRALRRLMYRHPPTSLQRQLAQFIAQGHYERCLRHHQQDVKQRWELLEQAREKYIPQCQRVSSDYSSSFWLAAPDHYNIEHLAWRAAHQGVLIESGYQHFVRPALAALPPTHFIRMGFGAIKKNRIEEGIKILSDVFETEK